MRTFRAFLEDEGWGDFQNYRMPLDNEADERDKQAVVQVVDSLLPGGAWSEAYSSMQYEVEMYGRRVVLTWYPRGRGNVQGDKSYVLITFLQGDVDVDGKEDDDGEINFTAKKLQAGTLEMKDKLIKLAQGLQKVGVLSSYTTDDPRRQRVYSRGLSQAGLKPSGLPTTGGLRAWEHRRR